MSGTVEVEGFKELFKKLDELPKTVFKDMGEAVLSASLAVKASAKENIESNFHGIGTLASSVKHKIIKMGGLAVAGIVGTNLPYASIHEFGGTITPKNVEWLTIPFKGVTGRARDYQNTFFAWTKNNKLVMFQNQGKGTKPKPLFVLVKQSQIPARPWLNPALEKNRGHITTMIGSAIKRSLASVARK